MTNSLDLWRNLTSSPFREFNSFHRSMDRMLEDFASRKQPVNGPANFNPLCEVAEDKAAYHFKIEMPGISKDQIKIQLEENQLTVSGERQQEKKEDDKRNLVSEFSYGSYLRSFTFPTPR